MNQNKNLHYYIEIAKSDLIVYFAVIIITFIISLGFSIHVSNYICLVITILPILFFIGKIISYYNLKQIKLYVEQNHLKKEMEHIIFWNEENLFLTDTYIIICDKEVSHFKYTDIESMKKKEEYKIGKMSGKNTYLKIRLHDKTEYQILIATTYLVNQEVLDITQFLIDKKNEGMNDEKDL